MSKNNINISHKFIDIEDIKEIDQEISNIINNQSTQKIEELSYIMSYITSDTLLNYLEINTVKKIFICPDITLKSFSSNLLKTKEAWIIKIVDQITNVIDISYLLRETESKPSCQKFLLGIGDDGSQTNRAISIANKWVTQNQNDDLLVIKDFGENNNNIFSYCESVRPDTLILIAHGLTDPNANINDSGAFTLQGSSTLWANEISELCDYTNHLILFTCKSGKSVGDHLETSNSVLSFVLSKRVNSILLCKWDVDVRDCLKILEEILNKDNLNQSLSSILSSAQRKFIDSEEWCHPVHWAGFEIWGKED